jgi:hypothetical protein
MVLLGLVSQLGPAFQAVRTHAADLAAVGALPPKEVLAEMIKERLKGFDPRIAGDVLLGTEEREALALGIAGLIRRMVVAEKKA